MAPATLLARRARRQATGGRRRVSDAGQPASASSSASALGPAGRRSAAIPGEVTVFRGNNRVWSWALAAVIGGGTTLVQLFFSDPGFTWRDRVTTAGLWSVVTWVFYRAGACEVQVGPRALVIVNIVRRIRVPWPCVREVAMINLGSRDQCLGVTLVTGKTLQVTCFGGFPMDTIGRLYFRPAFNGGPHAVEAQRRIERYRRELASQDDPEQEPADMTSSPSSWSIDLRLRALAAIVALEASAAALGWLVHLR